MTFNESILKFLEDRGMFKSQAVQVLDLLTNDKSQDSMKGRWNEDVADYPPIMENMILLTVKQFAIQWIDETMPLAWYRPMFT